MSAIRDQIYKACTRAISNDVSDMFRQDFKAVYEAGRPDWEFVEGCLYGLTDAEAAGSASQFTEAFRLLSDFLSELSLQVRLAERQLAEARDAPEASQVRVHRMRKVDAILISFGELSCSLSKEGVSFFEEVWTPFGSQLPPREAAQAFIRTLVAESGSGTELAFRFLGEFKNARVYAF